MYAGPFIHIDINSMIIIGVEFVGTFFSSQSIKKYFDNAIDNTIIWVFIAIIVLVRSLIKFSFEFLFFENIGKIVVLNADGR